MDYARIHWQNGTPKAADYGDIYFDPVDGAAESLHVFLQGNELNARVTGWPHPWFCIGETGFGTGLNFLLCWQLWEVKARPHQHLHFVSFEKHPVQADDIRHCLSQWPNLDRFTNALLGAYTELVPGWNRLNFGNVHLTLYIGDALNGLADCDARVQAWCLDGFAPERNPDLWSPALFHQLARLSDPGTTLATFTVARAVRDGLKAAGFQLQRVPGHGRKRHNLTARFVGPCGPRRPDRATRAARWPRPASIPGHVGIVGRGLAAAELVSRLEARDIPVTVIDPENHASGASGNRHGAVYVKPGLETDLATGFYAAAFSYRCRHWSKAWPGDQCGVLQTLATGRADRFVNIDATHPFAGLMTCVDAASASTLAGVTIDRPALWMPQAGWLSPRDYCGDALNRCDHWCASVRTIEQIEKGWSVTARDGANRVFSQLIIAAGEQSNELTPGHELPLRPVRGQVSSRQSGTPLRTVLCGDHYVTPTDHCGWWSYGATFQVDERDTAVRERDEADNLRSLHTMSACLAAALQEPTERRDARAGVRANTPDYLPMAGPVPHVESVLRSKGLRHGVCPDHPARNWYQTDLFVLTGLGSKGLATAPLLAEHLVSQLTGEPSPLGIELAGRLHPGRFAYRRIRRGD